MIKSTINSIDRKVVHEEINYDGILPYNSLFFDEKSSSFTVIHKRDDFQYEVGLKDILMRLDKLDIEDLMEGRYLIRLYDHLAPNISMERKDELLRTLLTLRSMDTTISRYIEVWSVFLLKNEEEGNLLESIIYSFDLYNTGKY